MVRRMWIGPNNFYGNTSFCSNKLFLSLFVARAILCRYGVYRWDSYNGKTSHKIISGPYSIVSGVNKWYIGIYWRYNRQKHNLIITNPHMEWQEGCGIVFYGVPLVDVVFERF